MTPTQAEIIIRLAENGINVAATARSMFMHRNNIDYHVRMIHRNTGKNPLNFYDLYELLSIAEEVLREKESTV